MTADDISQCWNAIVEQALERKAKWDDQHRVWNTIYYVAGIGATALALSNAALPAMFAHPHPLVYGIISLIASLLVAFVAFSNPAKGARAYRAAWRLLDTRVRAFQLNPTAETIQDVVDGMEEGERILAGRDPE